MAAVHLVDLFVASCFLLVRVSGQATWPDDQLTCSNRYAEEHRVVQRKIRWSVDTLNRIEKENRKRESLSREHAVTSLNRKLNCRPGFWPIYNSPFCFKLIKRTRTRKGVMTPDAAASFCKNSYVGSRLPDVSDSEEKRVVKKFLDESAFESSVHVSGFLVARWDEHRRIDNHYSWFKMIMWMDGSTERNLSILSNYKRLKSFEVGENCLTFHAAQGIQSSSCFSEHSVLCVQKLDPKAPTLPPLPGNRPYTTPPTVPWN